MNIHFYKRILILVAIAFISRNASATIYYNMSGLSSSDTLDVTICTDEDLQIIAPSDYSNFRWHSDPPPAGLINPILNIGGTILSVTNPASGGGNGDTLQISGGLFLLRSLFLICDSAGTDITFPIKGRYENMIFTNPASVDLGSDRHGCTGDSIQLFSLNTIGSFSMKWLPSNVVSDTLTVAISGTYEVHGCRAGDWIFTGVSDGCCTRDSVNVFIQPNPILTSNADTTLCAGDSLQINSIVSNTNSIYNHVWSGDISDFNTTNSINPIAIINNVGIRNYKLTVSDTTAAACSDSISFQVEMTAPINANLSFTDSTICASDSINLISSVSGGTPNYQLSWYQLSPKTLVSNVSNPKVQVNIDTKFILEISDSISCFLSSDTIQIIPTDLGIVNQSPNSQNDTVSLCMGQSSTLCIEGTGGNIPYSYSWVPSDSLTSLNTSCTSASPISSTDYLGRVTDSSGCYLELPLHVKIRPLPIVSLPEDTIICLNDTLNIMAEAMGGTDSNFTYTWWLTLANLDSLDSNSSSVAYFVKQNDILPNSVLVRVTDEHGCESGPDVMDIIGFKKPSASPELNFEGDHIFSDKTINGIYQEGTTLQFTSNAINSQSIQWILNSNEIVSEFDKLDTLIEDSGSYIMTLRLVAEQNACAVNYSIPFNVIDRISPHVYDVITANNDDQNPTLMIDRLHLFGNNELIIFNRWGSELYRTENYQNTNGWNAETVPEGTYFYHLIVDGDPLSPHKGSFMVIR